MEIITGLEYRFNTQPPEGGWNPSCPPTTSVFLVSTHSRPKAAGANDAAMDDITRMFQHTAARRRLVQKMACRLIHIKFQHTAARRRLVE